MRFLGKKGDRFNGLVYHPKVLKVIRGCSKWIQGLKLEGFTNSYRGPFIDQINQIRWWLIEEFSPDLIRFGSESFWFEPFVLKFTGCKAKKNMWQKLWAHFSVFFFALDLYKWLLHPPFWRDVLPSGVGKFLTSYISTQAKGFLFQQTLEVLPLNLSGFPASSAKKCFRSAPRAAGFQ